MNKKRLLYLDNLKVCLTVLVIFHHAGQAYGDGGDWAYHPSNPAEYMPWIWHFFSVNASFFMGLFFLISGYFVPMSFDRQGAKVFVQKKLIRLGIPLLLMGGLLSILSGKPEIGHMWYIESLLVFCLIYTLVRQFCKPIDGECSSSPTIIGLMIFGSVMGVGSYLIRQVSPQDHWIWPFGIIPLPMEPAHYLQYVMMFVIGILARRLGWLEKKGNTTGAFSLVLGCALALGIYLRDGGAWNAFVTEWFGIYESLLCIFICFGLLWLFREYGKWDNKFWQWCAAQSYGAYIFHLLLMIILQYATDGLWMGAFGKFMLIGIVTTICSFVLTWLVRLIPGAKHVLLLLTFLITGAIPLQAQTPRPEVKILMEIRPEVNYVTHLYTLAELGFADSAYAAKYGNTLPQAAIDTLHKYKNYMTFGQGEGGMLAGPFFFGVSAENIPNADSMQVVMNVVMDEGKKANAPADVMAAVSRRPEGSLVQQSERQYQHRLVQSGHQLPVGDVQP